MLNNTQKITDYAFEEFTVWLSNLEELGVAYGSDFYAHALNKAIERLQRRGLSVRVLEHKRPTLVVMGQFSSAADSEYQGEAQRICAAVGQEPITWGIKQAYLRVEVQALDPVAETGMGAEPGHSRTAHWRLQAAARNLRPGWRQSYQDDMCLASYLLNDLRSGSLALAFQPVATREYSKADPSLYYECLLRRTSTANSYGVPAAIQALERLGLVERLDRSVLWATLGALAASENLNLGCNVSASSFVNAAWWNEILAHLEDRPDLAQRLVVEITETSTFPEEKAALKLIRHLQLLGVRIALDDIGKEPGSLDILNKVRANIIKLDKSVLQETTDGELPLRLLQGMISICAEHGVSVVVEGIDSVAKLDVALTAGATGVQGYLIARPSLQLRGLLDDLVRVQDDMQTRASLTKGQDVRDFNDGHYVRTGAFTAPLFEKKSDSSRLAPLVQRSHGFRPRLVG